MKGTKNPMFASLGNGQAIAVGPWKQLMASAVGAPAAPSEITVLPFPKWELEDMTLDTGEASQKMVLEDIRKRELDIVLDYHHQSVHAAKSGIIAIAAGWLPWTGFVGGKDGVKAPVRWTERALAHVTPGANGEPAEFRYFSPVVLYDEETLEITALLSVALTNTPRTNKQPPLSAELAASIYNTRRLAASMEGPMKKWISILCSFLDSLWCYEPKELLAHIDKAREQFAKISAELEGEELVAAQAFMKALPKDATVLQALIAGGLKLPAGIGTIVASTDAAIPEDVLTFLELPKTTSKTELKAHLVGLKTSMVPRAEFEAMKTELAAAKEVTEKSKIETLLATYQDRFTPAEEPQLRKLAASDFAAVEMNLKNRQPIVAAQSQAKNAPARIEESPAEVKDRTADGRRVNVAAAERRVKVEKISREKNIDYEAANEELKKQELAQAV